MLGLICVFREKYFVVSGAFLLTVRFSATDDRLTGLNLILGSMLGFEWSDDGR